ncbi:MAG: hypothetical protein Q8L74_06900 [Nitrospirota bacterium]|nr:hypothetical protein [Nitrospirota bacterium]MDP2384045.1 hypothetical protein [Nitrospirota bacterium]MDP3597245.1 hypothetical protein [Nitrospirota bacterium]
MRAKRAGLDIKILGGLFLIFGTVDLIVIALFPSYAFKLFGMAVTGPSSYLVKLHAPAVHLLIGYGFLWLRPWAWGLSMAYAGFGLVSETMNQLSFGFHPVRSGFMATTMLFLAYLIKRRTLFTDEYTMMEQHSPASEETH